jgi:hypothetical protein
MNYELPPNIQDKFNFINELYPWRALMGQLIEVTIEMFGFCEWALPECDKDEELAGLQYCAAIDKLYSLEKTHLIAAGL